jgi:hypothetical protein
VSTVVLRVLQAQERSNAMNDTMIDLDQTEEATLVSEVADEALEAAADTQGIRHAPLHSVSRPSIKEF